MTSSTDKTGVLRDRHRKPGNLERRNVHSMLGLFIGLSRRIKRRIAAHEEGTCGHVTQGWKEVLHCFAGRWCGVGSREAQSRKMLSAGL
jgi:hypothetical protein